MERLHRPQTVGDARCSTSQDVAAAIGFARHYGLELSVRGGGHSFAGFAVCEQGLMIDLGGMRQVSVDPTARRAVCGGGATWADVDSATQAHALAVPGGVVSHTGIGGLTLGGGIGWLTRKAGLSSDNLLAAEVVTADGHTVRASDTENPELFWALRGGGGNFGVVASFEYRLHEVGPLVHLALLFFPADRAEEALGLAREAVDMLPAEAGMIFVGLSAPPAPFVPEEHHFAPGYGLVVVGYGSAEEHAEAIAPIRAASPLFELVTPTPYVELQQMFDEAFPWGTLAYQKALYLDEITDEVIDVIANYFPRKSSPLSLMPIYALAGPGFEQVDEDETAFGGSRSARFVALIDVEASSPELFEADRAWVRSFWEALRPHSSGAAGNVNFMAEYDEDRVRAAYGPAKYERLSRVKAKYDPDNTFHLNANIKPAPRAR
jgi:hypothetical protein